MNVPVSFDYLRPSPSLEEVLFSCRVPKEMRASCRALCCSVLFALTAWVLEGARLHRALQFERADADRYSRQLSALNAERVYEKRVQALTDLDRQVRIIAESGTLAARRLAALASDLPGNVWVTAITPDAAGVMLDGQTRDLNGLSDTLVRLNADPFFLRPSLMSAQRMAATAVTPPGLRFTLHIAARVP